ncbi:MAG: T9SS type A sorting domain-containing protein [Bacteroidia bacterium]|nr:T9SS type A sorting domain-containing protein [Bacteroidia bacterium]
MKAITIFSGVFMGLAPLFSIAQSEYSYVGDIGVNIQTQMRDSWELTGNMTVLRTVWRSETDAPEMVFYSPENTYDQLLALEVENLRIPDVPLADFSAAMEGNQATIQWATPVASDIRAFGVERSRDGNTWEKIGEVPVKNREENLSDFSFTDASPSSGTNYYRLRQENTRKKAGFSEVLALENLHNGWHVTYLFPNPLIFGTAIELNLYEPARVHIAIDDPEGNSLGNVYSQYTSMGNHQIELQMDHLPKGEYICRISVGDHLAVRRIQK